MNSALSNLSYTSATDSFWVDGIGNIAFTLSVEDGSTSLSAMGNTLVAVYPLQDAPSISASSSVAIESNNVVSFVQGGSETSDNYGTLLSSVEVSVADENYGDILTLTVTATSGHFSSWSALQTYSGSVDESILGSVSTYVSSMGISGEGVDSTTFDAMSRSALQRYRKSLVSSLAADSNTSSEFTLYGPVDYINEVIKTVVYFPPVDWVGLDTISYEVYDLTAISASASISVIVSATEVLPYIEASSVFSGVETTTLPL